MSIKQTNRLESLRFFLYERPLHPELFEIYDDVKITNRVTKPRFGVTGCTHVISFFRRRSNPSLKSCANVDNPLPSRGQVLLLPFRGEKSHEQKHLDGINYMMNLQAEVMSSRVYHQTHHELARQGAKQGLFIPFPNVDE